MAPKLQRDTWLIINVFETTQGCIMYQIVFQAIYPKTLTFPLVMVNFDCQLGEL